MTPAARRAIEHVLQEEGGLVDHPKARRLCSIDGCDSPYLARGFCNAHYLRNKSGVRMDRPVNVRRSECSHPGCTLKHYGSGYCRRHYGLQTARATKAKLVAAFGGRCFSCRQTVHPAAFDFHHIDPSAKEFSIGSVGRDRGWGDQLKEAKKCFLLCSNCHRTLHAGGFSS